MGAAQKTYWPLGSERWGKRNQFESFAPSSDVTDRRSCPSKICVNEFKQSGPQKENESPRRTHIYQTSIKGFLLLVSSISLVLCRVHQSR